VDPNVSAIEDERRSAPKAVASWSWAGVAIRGRLRLQTGRLPETFECSL
jgi:hypothetical protein